MIRFLLPRQLVAQAAPDPACGAFGHALGDAFRDAWPALVRAAWWSVPISFCGLLPSIFVHQVYDRVIARGGLSTLAALVAGVFGFLVLEFWLRKKRARSLRDAGATIDHGVSRALLGSMLRRPLRALEARPASVWFLLFRDVGSVRGTISGGLLGSVFDLPMTLFALTIIGILALPVLPVVIVFLCVLAVLAWWGADEVRAGKVEATARARDVDRLTSEICRARETLRTLGHDAPVVRMWQRTYDHWLAESFRKNGEIETAKEGTTVLLTVFSVITVTVGAIVVTRQWMSIGSLIAVNMLSFKVLSPVAGLASNWRSLARASEAAERLEKVLGEPVDKPPTGVELPRPRGQLRLHDVSFRFTPDGPPVLDHVDLEIGPAGLHAIVGRNGAGKSTLARLVAGLYPPDSGRVSLDEYDIAQFAHEERVQ
ncbi:MAG: Leukotoxin export ATP-binding protein LtxB [Xylophilus sp.]|nr:MAG: Leukotoxin export ATP-binding protein LtxB [Xylophilus sp.]